MPVPRSSSRNDEWKFVLSELTGLKLRLWPCLVLGLSIIALAQVLLTPCLTLSAEGRRLAMYEAGGAELTIDFIHSVQKTPVEERLRVSPEGHELELVETRYHSFGVGLPFLESEGEFRQEGNDFVITGMDRHFPELALRTGVGTELTVTVSRAGYAKRFELYEEYSPGKLIEVELLPLYKIFF